MPDNKALKIVLVDACNGQFPSLGLAYIAGYLRAKRNINNIKILQKRFYPDLVTSILNEQPDIVGYFSITPGFSELIEIIKKVREKNQDLLQIIGGPHITALPTTLPQEINVGVISEGEETMTELVDLFIKYGCLPVNELYPIKGIVFRDKEKFIQTERREGIKNLDDLPLPARDLLNIKNFYPVLFRGFPSKVYRGSGIMTTRGCPYSCIFCQEKALSRYRAHSAERAVTEIEELIEKYDANFVEIMDDQFMVNIERLRKIADLIRAKKLHKKATFFCYLRANQVTEESAALLEKINVKVVIIGFESGSDRILKYLKDQTCSVEQNQRAYDLCRRHGIHVYGTFIVGSPNETMADIEKTYNFIEKNPMATAEVFILTPLPGTKIWDYALEKKLVSYDMDWYKLLIKMSDTRKEKIWLAENINKEEFFKFYETKIRPLCWHYIQIANNFNISDLFEPMLWWMFLKRPKFYLSILKQSIIYLFKRK